MQYGNKYPITILKFALVAMLMVIGALLLGGCASKPNPMVLYENDNFGFSLVIPKDYMDKVEIQDGIIFTDKEIQASFPEYGGVVGRIEIYDKVEFSKDVIQNLADVYGLRYLGENEKYYFGYAHATDVQYPPEESPDIEVRFRSLEAEFDDIIKTFQTTSPAIPTTNAEGLNPYRHYDYAAWDSVKELSAESDAMFKGMVISLHSPEVMVTGYITSGGSNETLKDVYTISEIRVEKVMKGDLKPGDIVQIRQLGGLYNGIDYPTDNPEILTKNMEGIFLVKLNGNMPAELINPSQGLVKIVDGKVNNRLENQSYKKHCIVADDLTLDENNFKNGMSEDEVIELINKSL